MADLDKELADLKVRVAMYETELDTATILQEKQRTSGLINTSRETLYRLQDEKRKSLPHDSNRSFGIPWRDEKFDIFGNVIGLAQLAVGALGLGSLVAGGGLYTEKHHQ